MTKPYPHEGMPGEQQEISPPVNAPREHARRLLSETVERGSALAILGPVRAYDRDHGGDLVHTLRVYLECGGNASRAATNLYLHRSGLLYRLGRIQDLLEMELECFEDRVALELAVLADTEGKVRMAEAPLEQGLRRIDSALVDRVCVE